MDAGGAKYASLYTVHVRDEPRQHKLGGIARRIVGIPGTIVKRGIRHMLNSDVTFPAGLGQQMSCMRDCIASMFDEQAGLRSKTHAAVQLATTCENTVYRAPCYTPRESRDRCQCA